MKSFRVLLGLFFAVAALAVVGIVVLSVFTSWWVLFALFGVPPLLMMVGGVAMATRGGSFARFCADMSCASWLREDVAHAAPLR